MRNYIYYNIYNFNKEILHISTCLMSQCHEVTLSRQVSTVSVRVEHSFEPGLSKKRLNSCWKSPSMLRLCECRMMLASILPNSSNFDVKMTSNRWQKFGILRKMLYLCNAIQKWRARRSQATRTERKGPPHGADEARAGSGTTEAQEWVNKQ